MGKQIVNLIGQKFGMLTVIQQDDHYICPSGEKKVQWLCSCECGNETTVRSQDLVNGHTTSCGCKKIDRLKKYNEYHFYDDYVVGILHNSEDKFLFSISDYETIKNFCWIKHHSGYIVANDLNTGKLICLHKLLLGTANNEEVDHINGDKLDNRRENLRICTHQQNMMNRGIQKNNTSGVVGVYYNKKYSKWHARIKLNGKYIHLGFFDDLNEAAIARKNAEQQYFKEFARNYKEQ